MVLSDGMVHFLKIKNKKKQIYQNYQNYLVALILHYKPSFMMYNHFQHCALGPSTNLLEGFHTTAKFKIGMKILVTDPANLGIYTPFTNSIMRIIRIIWL